MNDLEGIAVWVEDIGSVITRIIFQSSTGRNIVSGASGHCGFVEGIDLILAIRHESPMNRRWIGRPLLDPEERPLAIAKSPLIRVTVFALVGQEQSNIKRL